MLAKDQRWKDPLKYGKSIHWNKDEEDEMRKKKLLILMKFTRGRKMLRQSEARREKKEKGNKMRKEIKWERKSLYCSTPAETHSSLCTRKLAREREWVITEREKVFAEAYWLTCKKMLKLRKRKINRHPEVKEKHRTALSLKNVYSFYSSV